MIAYEAKRLGGLHKNTFKDKKILIFLIMMFMQLMVFCHYAFATEVARIILQTFEEGCRTLIFFLMMDFFIKMSSKLLKKRERWLKIFKVLSTTAVILFIVIEIFVVYSVARDNLTDANLCDNSTYMIMQISNSVLLTAFIILGYFINKRVTEQNEADNKYEIVFRKNTQQRALENLKLIIVVFFCVQSYCLVYSISMFFSNGDCMYPTDSAFFGVFVWLLTRAV